MRKRFLLISLLVTLGGLIIFTGVATDVYYRNSLPLVREHLRVYMNAFDDTVSRDTAGAAAMSRRLNGVRVTFLDLSGIVVADSEGGEEISHSDREEVAEAILDGEGYAVRDSATIGKKLVYYCKRFDGILVRVAVPTSSQWAIFGGALPTVVWFLVLDAALCFIFTYLATGFIIRPVEKMTREAALMGGKKIVSEFKELEPLAEILNDKNRRIAEKIERIDEDAKLVKLLLNSMEHGIIVTDRGGAVLLINSAAAKIVGTENVGTPGLSDPELVALLSSDEACLIYKSYFGREYALRYTPGNDTRVLLFTDVTEIRRAERTKNEFISNVTHEMNTPLTSIKGFAELIEGGGLQGEKAKEASAVIIKQSDKLSSLIRSVINYSQIDNNELPLCEVDAAALTRDTLAGFAPKFAQRGLKVSADIEDGAIILSRPERVGEVLDNLVSNAVRYNRDGGEINVALRSDGLLTVADTGIGIEESHLRRIFDRFYTVDKSHGGINGGFGLGLAIVKKICARSNWELNVSSEKDKGTVFTVLFK